MALALGGVPKFGWPRDFLRAVANPERSGPALASIALDDRWSVLRDGAFVVRDKVIEVQPVAQDRDRERRLWDATAQLLEKAAAAPLSGRRARARSTA
ncbi:hypothetical protein [Actinospica sp.]|uniref:hypothetical protein n=1 Tax=Actinospica sp. TaxID=1872142 RepID=UPI002CB23641|nr:hypothetical protein [Actinospica sp.]HWG26226.1 hypothetical protein [Actinospica sp.]